MQSVFSERRISVAGVHPLCRRQAHRAGARMVRQQGAGRWPHAGSAGWVAWRVQRCDIKTRIFRQLFVENPRRILLPVPVAFHPCGMIRFLSEEVQLLGTVREGEDDG